jgi:betaine-aldehyde dehydrogenase
MNAQPPASHWIAGAPYEDAAGRPLEVRYPATGEVIARINEATFASIEAAVAAAAEGFAVWRATAPAARARVLRRAADLIRADARALAELETLDTGKPISETEVADWPSGADALEWFAALAATLSGEATDLGGDFAYTRREPLGICLGIGAWNYPSQIACWKAAPALACGNAMIFKPSEATPLGALRLAAILAEAGLPAGVFNVLQGGGDVGAALAAHPSIAKVSVTGSVPTGHKVYAAAAEGLKAVTLELGGKSPLLVFDDADLDDAVGGAMLGNFYSAGQVCSNATRVFVQTGARDAFLDRLLARTEKIVMGDPMDPGVTMGPLISDTQGRRVMDFIETGRSEGARLLCGGDRPSIQGFDGGFFVAPTVFADVTDDMTIAKEEIFGPVMSVLTFDSEDEAVARANATPYGLAAGVFTRDLARAHRVIARLEAGTTWINAYNLTPVEMPFGGVKESGLGRENGRAALDHWSRIKSVYVATGPVEAPW